MTKPKIKSSTTDTLEQKVRRMAKFLNPTLTINTVDDKVKIEISEGRNEVLTLTVQSSEFLRALGRLGNVACLEATLLRPEIAGRRQEHQDLEFPLPDGTDLGTRQQAAREAGMRLCPEGWTADLYFGSRNSFFTREGKQWARTIIRRWVKPTE